jgi:hypothetical protein
MPNSRSVCLLRPGSARAVSLALSKQPSHSQEAQGWREVCGGFDEERSGCQDTAGFGLGLEEKCGSNMETGDRGISIIFYPEVLHRSRDRQGRDTDRLQLCELRRRCEKFLDGTLAVGLGETWSLAGQRLARFFCCFDAPDALPRCSSSQEAQQGMRAVVSWPWSTTGPGAAPGPGEERVLWNLRVVAGRFPRQSQQSWRRSQVVWPGLPCPDIAFRKGLSSREGWLAETFCRVLSSSKSMESSFCCLCSVGPSPPSIVDSSTVCTYIHTCLRTLLGMTRDGSTG